MKFAIIALIAATSAIKVRYPFTGAHNCENGDSQRTFYPGKKGYISNSDIEATCTNNIGDAVDVQLAGAPPVPAPVIAPAYPAGLEHCPDLPERQTLRDGQTKPIVWPAKGANCIQDIHPGKEGVPAPYH